LGDIRTRFGISHENHAGRRKEYASLEIFQKSIGGSVIAAQSSALMMRQPQETGFE